MLLEINDNKPVAALQTKFSNSFPYLKIEFYTKAHQWQRASDKKYLVPPQALVGSIRNKKTEGLFDIKSYHKTGQVEKTFKRKYGLHVQVFRLQDNGWVQSTGTDDLTLREQMELAKGLLHKPAPKGESSGEDELESYVFTYFDWAGRQAGQGSERLLL